MGGLVVGGVVGYAVRQRGPEQAAGGGPIDTGFLQHMALHHDQAVAMSRMASGRASPAIRQLAESIAADQLQEIGQMKGWLLLWGRPQVPVTRNMDWMVPQPRSESYDPAYAAACRSAPGGMPGLATAEELDALRAASGPALDTLYLQYMLRHHQGALPMLRYAAEHAETEVVRQSAMRMAYAQTREVQQIGQLLAAMKVAPLADWHKAAAN